MLLKWKKFQIPEKLLEEFSLIWEITVCYVGEIVRIKKLSPTKFLIRK